MFSSTRLAVLLCARRKIRHLCTVLMEGGQSHVMINSHTTPPSNPRAEKGRNKRTKQAGSPVLLLLQLPQPPNPHLEAAAWTSRLHRFCSPAHSSGTHCQQAGQRHSFQVTSKGSRAGLNPPISEDPPIGEGHLVSFPTVLELFSFSVIFQAAALSI